MKRLTQRERADLYKDFVCGHVLVTLREAFAVAPSIQSARIAALRNDGPDAYGRPSVSCLLAAGFERAAFAGVQWDQADAAKIINDVNSTLVINQHGRTQELAPIALTNEPELKQLLDAVDLTELVSP